MLTCFHTTRGFGKTHTQTKGKLNTHAISVGIHSLHSSCIALRSCQVSCGQKRSSKRYFDMSWRWNEPPLQHKHTKNITIKLQVETELITGADSPLFSVKSLSLYLLGQIRPPTSFLMKFSSSFYSTV